MVKRLVFAGLVTASGAQAEAAYQRVVLPSGNIGYSIRCDNQTTNACYEKAGEICHRGYEIRVETKDAGFASSGAAVGNAFGVGAVNSATSTTEKGFLIECKESELTEKERSAAVAKQEELRKKQEDDDIAYNKRIERFVVIGLIAACATIGTIGLISSR